MYFSASEYLQADGVAGADAITRVDGWLHDRVPDDALDPRVVGSVLEMDPSTVRRLFEAYLERGVVRAADMQECPKCQTRAHADDVAEAQRDEDEFPCPGGCGTDLAGVAEPERIRVYHLIETPT